MKSLPQYQSHLGSHVQGSVLSPILCLIYINDLPDKTKVRFGLRMTAIYFAVSILEDAQMQVLDHLQCSIYGSWTGIECSIQVNVL